MYFVYVFFFKQNAAYEWRIRDWSSDVCSSDLARKRVEHPAQGVHAGTATVAEQDHRSFGRRVGCARENFLIPGRFCGVDLIDAQHQAADLFVVAVDDQAEDDHGAGDRKSTRLNSSP